MNLTHSHDWVAQRLLAHGAGLLAEAETLDVEQHLRSCPGARSVLGSGYAGVLDQLLAGR